MQFIPKYSFRKVPVSSLRLLFDHLTGLILMIRCQRRDLIGPEEPKEARKIVFQYAVQDCGGRMTKVTKPY